MKKFILVTGLICFLAGVAVGQRGGDKEPMSEESRKKIEASKVAYMTTYLDLSSEEAAKFWPIYNDYQDQIHAIRKARGERKKISDLTDSEATTRLDKYLDAESKKHILKNDYLNKFRTVISDRKVLMIYYAENEFRKQMVKRYTERKSDSPGTGDNKRDKE